ncbi:hypothetical protein [Paenibacillus terrigena]|uniref:hypothetical protein n=1 Tax=Paenibacillus terrigena TaxID=369333 RepID=UPI0028D4074C|nr:hypothetical protein [Paenibacillus terrigena]
MGNNSPSLAVTRTTHEITLAPQQNFSSEPTTKDAWDGRSVLPILRPWLDTKL